MLPLLFALVPQDADFFTGSPLAPGMLRLYRLRPAAGGAGQVVAAPALALRPLVFVQPVAAAPVARTARLQGLSRAGQPGPAGATGSRVDVSGWGSGAYSWRLAAAASRFYADDYLLATQPPAALEIDAAGLHAPPGGVYRLGSA